MFKRGKALKGAQKALKLAESHGDDAGRDQYLGLVDQLSSEETSDEADATESKPLTETEINLAFTRAEQALTLGQAKVAVEVLTPLIASADQSGNKEIEAAAAGMLAQALC